MTLFDWGPGRDDAREKARETSARDRAVPNVQHASGWAFEATITRRARRSAKASQFTACSPNGPGARN